MRGARSLDVLSVDIGAPLRSPLGPAERNPFAYDSPKLPSSHNGSWRRRRPSRLPSLGSSSSSPPHLPAKFESTLPASIASKLNLLNGVDSPRETPPSSAAVLARQPSLLGRQNRSGSQAQLVPLASDGRRLSMQFYNTSVEPAALAPQNRRHSVDPRAGQGLLRLVPGEAEPERGGEALPPPPPQPQLQAQAGDSPPARRASVMVAAGPQGRTGAPLSPSRPSPRAPRSPPAAAARSWRRRGGGPRSCGPARTAAATSGWAAGRRGGRGRAGPGRRYSRREVLELKRIFDSIDWSGGGTPLVADVLRALDSAADLAIRRLAEGLLERLQAKGSVASEQETLTFHQLIYALYPSLLKYEYEFIFSWTRPRVRERKKARPLTSEEKAEIAEIFGLYDRNGDGSLSLEEFVEAMQRTGISEDELIDVYYCHDLDHNSVISLSEFEEMMSNAYLSAKVVERAMASVGNAPAPPRLS
eukprot:tig00001501_g9221.t1